MSSGLSDTRGLSPARQRELLSGTEEGASSRDPRIEHLTGDKVGTAETRIRYSVAAGGFKALLVDRDSSVKLRSPNPIASAELFGHIEEMPVRRHESGDPERGDA